MFGFKVSKLQYLLILVAALLLSFGALQGPAQAQPRASTAGVVSAAYFHQRLAPYGTWVHTSRWGDVWHPRAHAGFQPYMDGHWAYTSDYGVIFVSTTIWGDIVYHYGRWVYDPELGWIWIPGYVWAPAWVVWRIGNGYIAWLPMPPCSDYYGSYLGTGIYSGGFYDDRNYGYECYQDWYGTSISFTVFLSYWIIIPDAYFFEPQLTRWRLHHGSYAQILPKTQNITNYVTRNNRVVNESFARNRLERLLRRKVAPVPLRDAIRKDVIITPVPSGSRLEQEVGPRVRRAPLPAHPAPLPHTVPVPGKAPAATPERKRQPDRKDRERQTPH